MPTAALTKLAWHVPDDAFTGAPDNAVPDDAVIEAGGAPQGKRTRKRGYLAVRGRACLRAQCFNSPRVVRPLALVAMERRFGEYSPCLRPDALAAVSHTLMLATRAYAPGQLTQHQPLSHTMSRALKRLSIVLEDRSPFLANRNLRLSLRETSETPRFWCIATKKGLQIPIYNRRGSTETSSTNLRLLPVSPLQRPGILKTTLVCSPRSCCYRAQRSFS